MFEEDNSWSGEATQEERRLHRALFGKRRRKAASLEECGSVGVRDLAVCDGDTITTDVNSKQKVRERKRRFPAVTEKLQRPAEKKLKRQRASLRSKMLSKIEGSRFRWINEQLYTETSKRAKELFQSDPDLFTLYHQGFNTQVAKWPVNPLDRVIKYVKALPETSVIADFGCGEGRLAKSVSQTVHSFDLVAVDDHVTACDMASVPLTNSSVDVCVFCLSLMGTNTADFVREGRRVLRDGGSLRICEIESRIPSVQEFVVNIERCGFKLVSRVTFSKMFVELHFRAAPPTGTAASAEVELRPCVYKKR